jgi:hypothetical protein
MSSQSTETRGQWLWRKLGAIFGARFLDMWANIDPADVQTEWTSALHGLPREALQRGVSACYHMRQPPTLPEFLEACRAQPAMYANRTLTDETNRTPPDEARARLAEAAAAIAKTEPGIAWAYRLIERADLGEPVTVTQLEHARAAIAAWETTHGTANAQGEGEPLREPGCDDELEAL